MKRRSGKRDRKAEDRRQDHRERDDAPAIDALTQQATEHRADRAAAQQ